MSTKDCDGKALKVGDKVKLGDGKEHTITAIGGLTHDDLTLESCDGLKSVCTCNCCDVQKSA